MWEQFLRVLIGVPNSQLTTNFLAKYQLTANPISTLISICTTHLEAEFIKNINSRISVLAEISTNENVAKEIGLDWRNMFKTSKTLCSLHEA